MNISLPQFPDTDAQTNTSEGTFKKCNRLYFLRYRLGLVPSHDGDALRVGGAFHEGLEAAKAGGDDDAVEARVRAAYAERECPPWLTSEDFDVEQETAVALAVGWRRRWANDLIVDYVAVELPFDLPIINPATGKASPRVRNRGKIDGIARLPDGRLALIEHKTTGDSIEADSDYWRRLLLDSQISRYVLAARQLGFAIDTTIYDATRKPAIRPKLIAKADRALATSQGHYFGVKLTATCPERETPQLYGARLRDDLAKRPEFYFARMEIPRLESDLREFQTEQWVLMHQIRDCELEEREGGAMAWPRNTNACTGMYPCTYLDICRGMRGDPTQEVPAGFRITERLHPELVVEEVPAMT